MPAGFWAALFGAIGVISGIVSTYLLGRRKARADADTQIGAAAGRIAQVADEQIERMGLWLADANRRAVEYRQQNDYTQAELLAVRARLREVEHAMTQLRAQIDYERVVSQQTVARLTASIQSDRDLFRTELTRLSMGLDQRSRAAVDDLLKQLVGADMNGRPDDDGR